MRAAALMMMMVVAVGVHPAKLPMPRLSDEERALFLSDMDKVVDCLIEPQEDCHPYTNQVRNMLPDLIHNRFKCHCDAQGDVDLFRRHLSLPKNRDAFKKLSFWLNDSAFH